MNRVAEDILMHYGVARRSGRYPWGSGDDPYQHSGDFLSRIDELKSQGLSEVEIAKSLGMSTTELRTQKSLAKAERRALEVETAKRLRYKEGLSLDQIAEKMGYKNDSSIRSLLNENSEERMNKAKSTADFLRKQIEEKGMIDVGKGVERELGISEVKLKEALSILENEGYLVYGGGIPQVTNPGKQTNVKVLCKPGTEHKEIYDFENVHSLAEYNSKDGGETFDKLQYPKSMSSDRIAIRYAEDGGLSKDGVVEIRRGVDDLSLGNSHYAQVRILVDGTHYVKGMAIYSDDVPKGYDMIFNTNKSKATDKMDVLKKIKDDPDNPFGALIKANGQSYYYDKDGKKQLSPINKTKEEGDWAQWADKLPSQFLSKQSLSLMKKQLNLSIADRQAEYDEICSLTNPVVKKKLLKDFADVCDSQAEHLYAAALPRQKYQVILPVDKLKDTEVYAPNYRNGEKVALVRYPHGGTFEIPIVTVNNKHSAAKNLLGNAIDAIGINSKVAERLSGADFDGDTVMVIPTHGKNGVKINSTPPLSGLVGFDPKASYPEKAGMRYLTKQFTGNEMGKISNLISDMTLKGATPDEVTRAVKHSMVVIDAEKHKLNYKQSELDNDIDSLRKKYQSHDDDDRYGGASTIISRAKSQVRVNKRVGSPDPEEMRKTGKIKYKEVVEEYIDKNGKKQIRTIKSTAMNETDDAFTLVSKYRAPAEIVYAEYANKLKAMANDARKTMMNTENIQVDGEAKKKYAPQIDSLMAKLNLAEKNRPRERRAQMLANTRVKAKKQANPDMSKEDLKKLKNRELVSARNQVGAKRVPINIEPKEWEAIQSGAVSSTRLSSILDHADPDQVKKYATPRSTTELSTAKQNKISSMSASGYTNAEIADSLGVSPSTVSKYLNQ